ncbi:MAG: hypothetical protein F6K28_62715, partial [Microcoleus sp. SIO2G3]|nr:hypothetical protein [Microcoleus sp. SIO2G3]
MYGAAATNNLIAGNWVGLASDGESEAGNGGHGIYLDAGASGNTVGGTAAADRNVVAGNGGYGVLVIG